jgi:DUF4097 and DUF4098 domain-containing protein YvlB
MIGGSLRTELKGARSMATHHTPGTARLRITLPAGTVEITTTETSDTVVNVEPLNHAARDLIDSVKERARSRRETEHEVIVEIPDRAKRSRWFGVSPAFRVEVTAPTRSSVEVTAASADITCTGTCGDVDLRSASGDASFPDVEGDATTKTASGDVSFGRITGRARHQTVSGDVAIRHSSGSATVTTVSGDVRVEEASDSLAVKTVSSDIHVGAAGSEVKLHTVSGDAEVGVRSGARVWMDLQSMSGETSSDLDVSGSRSGGDADVEIRARSVSGDIRVSRTRETAASTSQ